MKKHFPALFFLLLACFTASAQKLSPVYFAHGVEYFPENFASLRQNPELKAAELIKGKYARYIQLEKIMNATERVAFEATGAKIIGYIHFGVYLVLLPQNFDFSSIETYAPRSVVSVNPVWKMAKSLREQPYGKWALRGDYVDINIQIYPSLTIPEGAELCAKNGLEVLKQGTQNGFLQLRVHKDQIAEIAALSFIQYLELVPPPSEKDDTKARSLHRTNLIDSDAPMGKKYNGEGVNTLVRDDGTVGPHIDFKGRLDNLNATEGVPSHGDYVAGCVGGAGNINPSAKGMATGAFIYVTDYYADFQDQTLSIIENKNITITNTSYTDGYNAGYTINAQTVDQQLFDHPNLTHVFSAGNANDDNIDYGYGAGTQWGNISGGHKMAKNAFLVANITANGDIDPSSSRGPATDGRLKPDISALGDKVNMTQPNNTYSLNSGTSFSAPNIAGCMAQLTQAFRTINNVTDVPSALLKATMLNTANDLGNVGPDFIFGWGHVNSWRALQLLEQHNWTQGSIDQNGDATHTIQIPAGVKAAKIMIYWPESPALVNSAKTLINDLDLTVSNSAGTSYLPWILDPSPVPAKLNTPATKGRDSLNNVEQVLIDNPAAGTYTVHVKGTEVPLGPQPYFMVWEFLTDEIKMTYPAGGEGFIPGEVERIYWDAIGNTGTFTLRYSVNGGNTFSSLASLTGDKRMYDWTVPNTVSGNVKLMLIRGGNRDTTDYPFSIAPIPQNLKVSRVCPDSITLSWTKVNDTLAFDAYMLGSKYMELMGTTNNNSFTYPLQNAGSEQWLSVRNSYPDGTTGLRALATNWPGGLLNCPQQFDLGLSKILSPTGDAIVSCGSSDLTITIQVKNEGLIFSTGALAYYQVNNNPPVTEPLPDIPVGASINFSFQSPIQIDISGVLTLKTWVVNPVDLVSFNDTLEVELPVVSESVNHFFTEDLEAKPGFPDGWVQVNPDGGKGWETINQLVSTVIGPDDMVGQSFHLNFYQYGPNQEGMEDYLYMIPVDLSGLDNPTLTFEVAHARYNANFADALRVEAFTNCDLSGAPITIWEKTDPDLATVPNHTEYYYAGSGADWRKEIVDLSAFADQKLIIRFVSTNGYGNSLFLDDIGINPLQIPVLPIAEFMVADTLCRLDTTIFTATPSTAGAFYNWSFGLGASPSTATGIGPHSVIFPTAGNKTVRLIVSNDDGKDTLIQVVNVRQLATANFTFTQNLLTVTFNNTSSNASSYLWDFGDGTNSTDPNPIHTYTNPGTYTVSLSSTNACRTHVKTSTIGLTGINELTERLGILILPNPTEGDFVVEVDSRMIGNVTCTLFDAAGRKVSDQALTVKYGINRIPFEGIQLPKGLYQLNIQSEGKQASFKIAVQ